ncbi:MAG: hypothetical protein E7812_16250 [Phenylobacterium sp.]|nr:MAG: hypothetical protein E7812_16250 [Phenylobacterium sp.]
MAHDESDPTLDQRPAVSRTLLFGGIAGACLMGAGLGLWARPAAGEHPGPSKPLPVVAEAPPPAGRRLQVVVDDNPAPIGKPLDVLPAAQSHAGQSFAGQSHADQQPASRPVAPIAPEPKANRQPPLGLLRVAAPALARAAPHPKKAPPQAPPARVMQAPRPLPVVQVRTATAPRPAASHHLRVAKAEHTSPAPKARAERPERFAKLAVKHARPKAREVEVAEAPPPPKPRRALLALAHAIARLAPHHARVAVEERADAAPDHGRKASLRDVRLTKAPLRTHSPRIERFVPPLSTKGAGPIKVASVTTRCVSPDPGEALACGDPNLGAAARRLTRAYHEAEVAGVPVATLEQQQQRWLAARATAAREAPWAVREVYQARIAELQDMARDAQGN